MILTAPINSKKLNNQIEALENLSKQRDKAFGKAYEDCRSGNDCNNFYYLYVIQRRDWNKDSERLFRENRQDWIMMNDEENIFHNFNHQGVPQKMFNGNYRYKSLYIIMDKWKSLLIPKMVF